MISYTVPPHDEATFYVIQEIRGKGRREAIHQYGDILCESCDYVLANEGETITIGHTCRRCNTPVVDFLPVKDEKGDWLPHPKDEPFEEYVKRTGYKDD